MEMNINRITSTTPVNETTTSVGGNSVEAEGNAVSTYPFILSGGKYFTVESTNSTDSANVNAVCVHCKTTIRGSLRATSNFRTHLKRKHPDVLSDYETRKVSEHVPGNRQPLTKEEKTKQTKLNFSITEKNQKNYQEKFDSNIMKYIVHSMKPLSTVDDPNFINIFNDLPLNLKVMSRRTLGRKIEITQKEIIQKLETILSDVEYVSTTADIWSTKTRSFMGVTAHWINTLTLECQSCVLSFNRFKGAHTYDKIAEMLFEIQASFKLKHHQVISTTTDNGSNFVKAFREFGITDFVPEFLEDDDVRGRQAGSVEALESTSASEILYEEALLPVNIADDFGVIDIHLPRHLRCASHTLSLLATTDLNNFIKNSRIIGRVHNTAIGKCTLLWNMSRKPKSAEIIKNFLGHQLIYPCPTRWNSLYDSIVHLMKTKVMLNELFIKLDKTCTFSAIELEYLDEFVEVLRPIATALDYLQGNNCYYGKLLPTLYSIKTRLNRLEGRTLRHFAAVIPQLRESLEKRFEKFFNLSPESNEAILASCFHPSFKMRWLSDDITASEKQRIQNLAIQSLEISSKKREEKLGTNSRRSSTTSKEDDDFIVLNKDNSDKPQSSKMELELVSFLNDQNKELSVLNNYPNIKEVFIKYNTHLCSSGPVERLFSLAGFIHSPTRGCLSDNSFESLVFVKGNSSFQ